MTIKARLNIIAVLSVGAVLVLFGFLLYNNNQMTHQRDQIEQVEQFAKKVFEIEILTEQYLTYGEQRYLNSWSQHYKELQESKNTLKDFPKQNVISNSLPSIKNAFELIQNIQTNPELYPDLTERERLLSRAQSRIRSDIQLLLAATHNLVNSRRQNIRNIQADQRTQFLSLMIPAVLLIVYVTFRIRKRIIYSLNTLLQGTKNITQGNMTEVIDITGDDEHNQLADSFNTMTAKLRKVIQEEQTLRLKAQQNEKRWEKLVEQIPNLIIISIDGKIKFINTAGVDIIGAKNENQILGLKVYDLLDDSYRDRVTERIEEVQDKKQKGAPTLYKINTLDGQERYLQLESQPIKYDEKDAMQTVGIDMTEYVKYEKELQSSLEEKTVLLQEIHHRVKNNLAVISGLMQLQAMESDSELLKAQLNDSLLRIHSMALIHELLYKSENFSKLKMKDHIREMVNAILGTVSYNTHIDVEYDIEDVIININQAIPCALILNELVTNSIKHGFRESDEGRISIKLKEKNGRVLLSVRDNGIGLPEGFSVEENSSFGMLVSKTLASQLNTSIKFDSNNGSNFYLEFEKSEIKGVGSNFLT